MATYTLQGPDVVIVSSSVANPTVITAPKHGFSTGNSVDIEGHVGSTPAIDGTHTITKTGENTFTIPVNVTVGGTGGRAISARTPKIETLEATWAINQADVLRCKFISLDRHYIPAKYSKTFLYEDATPILGGTVSRVIINGLGSRGVSPVECTVEVVSFKNKAKNRYVTLTAAAGTDLGTILAAIESGGFFPSGISLSGSQATGPTIAQELVWNDMQLAAVLDQLSELTGWPWDILPDETLEMFEPGATAAPYDITTANQKALDDIQVERAANGGPNQIIVKAGTASTVDKTDTFTGDGATDTFDLRYPIAGTYGYVTCAGIYETLRETSGFPGSATWVIDRVAQTITRDAGPPANLDAISITYIAQFPITVRVPEIAPADVIEKVILRPDVFDYDVAFAIGSAELALATDEPDTIRYKTLEPGYIKPGQTQTITVAERDTDLLVVVTEVTLRNVRGNRIQRDITAVSGEVGTKPVYREIVKAWLDRGGGASAGAGVSTVAAGPGGPPYAVQFNNFGAFGGDEDFKYFPDTHSVVCGDLSDITAFAVESCQVFGYDNHIADP